MSQVTQPIKIFDHQRTLVRLLSEFENPRAVEVGVASGRTSEYLLKNVPTLFLWMVDQWKCPSTGTRKTQEQYDQARETAICRTEFAAERRLVYWGSSAEGAIVCQAKEIKFDLIFIDAHHEYESVIRDLLSWWRNLKSGGFFCGHDIDSDKDNRGVWGVRKAVEEFSRSKEVNLPFEVDKNTWIMRKP